jgi:hypothetical protein
VIMSPQAYMRIPLLLEVSFSSLFDVPLAYHYTQWFFLELRSRVVFAEFFK